MSTRKSSLTIAKITLLFLVAKQNVYPMGLRSFVALPIDKYGYVVRATYEHISGGNRDNYIASVAYGLSHDQALLLGIPYQIRREHGEGFGDLSALYRHTVIHNDFFSGTSRLALLAGVIVPGDNDRDPAVQAGWVYTFFKDRN